MAKNQRKTRRVGEANAEGRVELVGVDEFDPRLEIRLPEWWILRIAARSLLLALVIFSFPWTGTKNVFHSSNAGTGGESAASAAAAGDHPIDDVFFLPIVLRDLKREGVFRPGISKAVLLAGEDHRRFSLFIKQYKLIPITAQLRRSVRNDSVDFVLSGDGTAAVDFVDRILKVGGILAVRLSSDPSVILRLPPHYKPVYVRRFGSTIVAMKKAEPVGTTLKGITIGRKLLAVSESTKTVHSQVKPRLVVRVVPAEQDRIIHVWLENIIGLWRARI